MIARGNSGLASIHRQADEMRRLRRAALLDAMVVGKLVLARDLASKLGICERSVYRHIAGLRAEGAPIAASKGVGFMRRAAS